jgi:hypothetical protein
MEWCPDLDEVVGQTPERKPRRGGRIYDCNPAARRTYALSSFTDNVLQYRDNRQS